MWHYIGTYVGHYCAEYIANIFAAWAKQKLIVKISSHILYADNPTEVDAGSEIYGPWGLF